jgi:5-methylcytosine-specific restriction protein A
MKNLKKDKQRIYNSREWRQVRIAKLERNPLCEVCDSKGLVVPAQCVHHIIPIETAHSFDDMRRLAFRFDNLMSLCFACHGEIHRTLNSHTREGHQQTTANALERWKQRVTGQGHMG